MVCVTYTAGIGGTGTGQPVPSDNTGLIFGLVLAALVAAVIFGRK